MNNTIKLPSEYPPELPVRVASDISNEIGSQKLLGCLIFGANLPSEFIKQIIGTHRNFHLKADFEEIGFHLLGDKEGESILSYSQPVVDEYVDIHENMSLALHVFKYLGFDKVAMLDGVMEVDRQSESIYHIVDYINLTGINPLDYWMMPKEPEPFFLDVKDLFIKDNLNYQQTAHLSIAGELLDYGRAEANRAGVLVYGKGFCPECILAGYLGMKVLGLGVVIPFHGNTIAMLTKIIDTIKAD